MPIRDKLAEKILSTPEGQKAWHQERVILDASYRLCELMDERGINRTELAQLLGKSKGFVSQILDGSANMTLRTLSDTFLALGRAYCISDRPLERDESRDTPLEKCVLKVLSFNDENVWAASGDDAGLDYHFQYA